MNRRRLLLLAALAAVIAIVAGTALLNRGKPPDQGVPTATPPARQGRFRAVPPATVRLPDTAVERRVNAGIAAGLAASGQVKTMAAAQVPAPGYIGGWTPLAVSNNQDQWAREFTAGLLDIDFAHQTRTGLGRWLMAVEAPELVPGIPVPVANKTLYLSLLDRAAAGGGSTPIPSAAGWATDAAAGVRWHVSDLSVTTDPTYSRLIAQGWQPPDVRFSMLDITGALATTTRNSQSETKFRFELYVGSAHWQHGYGSVVLTNWRHS